MRAGKRARIMPKKLVTRAGKAKDEGILLRMVVRRNLLWNADAAEDGRTLAHSLDLTPIRSQNFEDDHLTYPFTTVQGQCIPQAILGTDVICQAKSGLGKTAVFVLASLQQIEPVQGETSVLVMCHTRELAYQIRAEYQRFGKYMPNVKTGVFYGGTPIVKDIELLNNKETHPHIIVGTPGRLNALVRDKNLKLGNIRQFILDECDKMLDQVGKNHLGTLNNICSNTNMRQTCAAMCRRSSVPLLPRSRS